MENAYLSGDMEGKSDLLASVVWIRRDAIHQVSARSIHHSHMSGFIDSKRTGKNKLTNSSRETREKSIERLYASKTS